MTALLVLAIAAGVAGGLLFVGRVERRFQLAARREDSRVVRRESAEMAQGCGSPGRRHDEAFEALFGRGHARGEIDRDGVHPRIFDVRPVLLFGRNAAELARRISDR